MASQDIKPSEEASDEPVRKDRAAVLRTIWREYWSVIIIAIFFVPGCIWYTVVYFPELGMGRSIFSGLLFGVFCTMCAASGRVFR